MAGQEGIPPLAVNICNVVGFISSVVTAVSNLLLKRQTHTTGSWKTYIA